MGEDVEWELGDTEAAALDRDGYVVRASVFTAAECARIADDCEALLDDLVRDRQGSRMVAGSYVFDPDMMRGVIIKWEGDSDVVHGIEPFAHLSRPLKDVAEDERFMAPMRRIVGDPDPMLFTEKLNFKRAEVGGPNPLHRDFPYWAPTTPRASEVATAILFLDEATLENGCLEVVPGSHRSGEWAGRTDGDFFAANEIDTTRIDMDSVEVVPVEVPAGSMVMFGAFLVHRSAPNRSGADRRALLFSYQPRTEPCPTQLDLLRAFADSTRST